MTTPTRQSDATTEKVSSELPLPVRKSPAVRKPRRRWLRALVLLPLLAIVVAVAGVTALYFQPQGLQRLMARLELTPGGGTPTPIAVATERAFRPPVPVGPVKPERVEVVGLGTLVPAGDIRTVSAPFGAGDASVSAILVEEGDRVEAGEIVARLDNRASLEAALANAEANVASKEAALAQTRAATRSSRAETEAALVRARSALATAEADLKRTADLKKRGFTTNAVMDQKRAAFDGAASDVAKLEATLARFGADEADEQPDVVVASRALDAAKADLARARSDLSRSEIRSPLAGNVISIEVRPGERPGTDGVMQIGDIDRMTAVLEIYQSEIGRVRLGLPVKLQADALPSELSGTVSRIGLEVSRQKLVGASPASNTDARVVEVEVALDEASLAVARNFTNLQVLARIDATPPAEVVAAPSGGERGDGPPTAPPVQ